MLSLEHRQQAAIEGHQHKAAEIEAALNARIPGYEIRVSAPYREYLGNVPSLLAFGVTSGNYITGTITPRSTLDRLVYANWSHDGTRMSTVGSADMVAEAVAAKLDEIHSALAKEAMVAAAQETPPVCCGLGSVGCSV